MSFDLCSRAVFLSSGISILIGGKARVRVEDYS